MTITLSFSAWMIPTVITLVLCGCAIYLPKDDWGITQFVYLVPALFISMISWIVWGIFT